MTSIHLKIHLLIIPTVIKGQVILDQLLTRIHRTTEHALFVVKCSLDQIISPDIWEVILEKNHMRALNVTNDLTRKAIWTDISSLTLERSHTRVNTAATHVHWKHILPCIYEHTQDTNLSRVMFAGYHLQQVATPIGTNLLTLVRKGTSVKNVGKCFHRRTVSPDTFVHIPARNHTGVMYVVRCSLMQGQETNILNSVQVPWHLIRISNSN